MPLPETAYRDAQIARLEARRQKYVNALKAVDKRRAAILEQIAEADATIAEVRARAGLTGEQAEAVLTDLFKKDGQ